MHTIWNERIAFALPTFGVAVPPEAICPLTNRSGFSDSLIWRIEDGGRSLCARLWPENTSQEYLATLHTLQLNARAQGLGYIADVVTAATGHTTTDVAGRWLEVTSWLPGIADFRKHPTEAKLVAVLRALARLHLVWGNDSAPREYCNALRRRRAALERWRALDTHHPPDVEDPLVFQAWTLFESWKDRLIDWLLPWQGRRFVVQPCLCDPWHDNILFEGDTLTGLIDYGEVKIDSPAVDLGRMVGSLVEDDESAWQVALSAYREVRPLSREEEALSRVLDRSGILIGIANWLRWLWYKPRRFENPERVRLRLAALVDRVERWSP